jgi:hypothetical protein
MIHFCSILFSLSAIDDIGVQIVYIQILVSNVYDMPYFHNPKSGTKYAQC